ncbi:RE1 [Symbiodinium sp. CCMP2592]|nr:RE1 [Symbiodinium sp. CCMP2592]
MVQGTPVTLASLSAQLDNLRAMVGNPEVRTCRVDPYGEIESSLESLIRDQACLRKTVERYEAKVCEGCPPMPSISTALLDSGATHAVVPYRPDLGSLDRVPVTLAGDAKEEWWRTQGGTLVIPPSQDGSMQASRGQTILPLGALVQHLGCQGRQGLKIRLPNGVLRKERLHLQSRILWSLASAVKGAGIPYLEELARPPSELSETFRCWSGTSTITLYQGALTQDYERFTRVMTNLDLSFLGTLPRDGASSPPPKGREWTLEFRKEVVNALRGRPSGQSVEELDRIISEARLQTEPSVNAAEQTTFRDQLEAEALRRAFEEESVLGDDDDEHFDVQGVLAPRASEPDDGVIASDVANPTVRGLNGDEVPPEVASDHEDVPMPDPHPAGRDETCITGKDLFKGVESSEPPPENELAEYEPSEPSENLFPELFDDEPPPLPPPSHPPQLSPNISATACEDLVPQSLLSEQDLPADEEGMKQIIEELREPVDQVLLRYCIPLRTKSGAEVTEAIQRMILEINQAYPVLSIHHDPGTEFSASALSRWLAEHGVRTQHSLPTDKKGNGLSERTVGWVKSRIRTLLKAAKLSVEWWPLAARWAVSKHNALITGGPDIPAFGQQVLHRIKRPADGVKQLMERWVEARYAAPHRSVTDGHVLITSSGNLEEEDPDDPPSDRFDEYGKPLKRIKGKSAVRFVEYTPTQSSEEVSRELLIAQDYSLNAVRQVLSAVTQEEKTPEDRRGIVEDRQIFGAYCHGGLRGVTTRTKGKPLTTRFLNRVLATRLAQHTSEKSPTWASIMLMRAGNVEVHRDWRNEWGTLNYTMHVALTEVPLAFDPRQHHAVRMQPNWLIVTELSRPILEPLEHRVNAVSISSEDTSESSIDSEELQRQIEADSVTPLIGWDFSTGDPGDKRPDSPQLSSLTTGEVRLIDSPPLAGLGCKQPDARQATQGRQAQEEELSPLEVTHNVSPAEVRRHLTKWRPAARAELDTFEKMSVIRKFYGNEARAIVSCGNYAKTTAESQLYAGGAGAECLRTLLVHSARRGRRAYGLDVKSAFLLAGIPEGVTKRYAMRPPRLLIDLGLAREDEVWIIDKALYGFRESPRWWSLFRDSFLLQAKWKTSLGEVTLEQFSSESDVWRIRHESGECIGHLLVYVDDILVLTEPEVAEAFISWLREHWECTGLKEATVSSPLRFLGVDIYAEEDEDGTLIGFSLQQEAYIDELLRSHEIKPNARATAPVPREWVRDLPPLEEVSEQALRAGQRITGELLWVSQRTRLDIGFCVGLMASWVSRFPAHVTKIGGRVLEYLAATKTHRLNLIPGRPEGLRIFTDASFAPYGSHSISGILLRYDECTVVWKSRRQSLVTLSTAESELCAGCEGVTLSQSLEALIVELDGSMGVKNLMVDNIAAITLAEGGGSVRTRHLRVRAAFIHDMRKRQELAVSHCPGDEQLADCLTKVKKAGGSKEGDSEGSEF